MVNPIEIRTISGVRLDVFPSTTIEVNMGGLSLLNLQDRTATYTNSFTLPRTKVNEAVFEFASQPTRSNRPSINVMVSKGLFQRQAVLKVLSFDKEYKCSVSYGNGFEKLKDYDYEIEFDNSILATSTTETNFVQTISQNGYSGIYAMLCKLGTIPTSTELTNSLFFKVSNLFGRMTTKYGSTFSGDLLADADFQKMFVNIPRLYIKRTGINHYTFESLFTENRERKVRATDLIRAIAYLFFADIIVSGNNIELKKINTSAQGIALEGFSSVLKIFNSGFAETNIIKYDISKEVLNTAGFSDSFLADGVGQRDVLIVPSYIPRAEGLLYDYVGDADINNKISLMAGQVIPTQVVSFNGSTYTVTINRAAALTMSGFYSSILNPIFANPVILEAEKNFDPLTADNIMNTRIINSVQLGGRYWVDSFAYNLTTGNSKMKLIKLP